MTNASWRATLLVSHLAVLGPVVVAFPPPESELLFIFSTINGFTGDLGGESSFACKSSAPSNFISNFAFGLTPTVLYMAITVKQKPGNNKGQQRTTKAQVLHRGRGMQLLLVCKCGKWLLRRTAKSVSSDTQQTLPPLWVILHRVMNRSRNLYIVQQGSNKWANTQGTNTEWTINYIHAISCCVSHTHLFATSGKHRKANAASRELCSTISQAQRCTEADIYD